LAIYLKPQAIKQALKVLSGLPKNQTALFYFLIFATCPEITKKEETDAYVFEREFYKYFGGPIKGGGTGVFDPFGHEWRAENYLYSTVYGRLLTGSHKWTEGSEAFFDRKPSGGGWPATFKLSDRGFDNLKERNSPPCLKYDYRLPIAAVAIYYYRFLDLSSFNPQSIKDVVSRYKKDVLSKHPRLKELFIETLNMADNIFQNKRPSEEEMINCYPTSPYSTKEKTRELLYRDDVQFIKSNLKPGEQVADYVRALITEAR
jgi:hypothetical protein